MPPPQLPPPQLPTPQTPTPLSYPAGYANTAPTNGFVTGVGVTPMPKFAIDVTAKCFQRKLTENVVHPQPTSYHCSESEVEREAVSENCVSAHITPHLRYQSEVDKLMSSTRRGGVRGRDNPVPGVGEVNEVNDLVGRLACELGTNPVRVADVSKQSIALFPNDEIPADHSCNASLLPSVLQSTFTRRMFEEQEEANNAKEKKAQTEKAKEIAEKKEEPVPLLQLYDNAETTTYDTIIDNIVIRARMGVSRSTANLGEFTPLPEQRPPAGKSLSGEVATCKSHSSFSLPVFGSTSHCDLIDFSRENDPLAQMSASQRSLSAEIERHINSRETSPPSLDNSEATSVPRSSSTNVACLLDDFGPTLVDTSNGPLDSSRCSIGERVAPKGPDLNREPRVNRSPCLSRSSLDYSDTNKPTDTDRVNRFNEQLLEDVGIIVFNNIFVLVELSFLMLLLVIY